MDWIDHLPPDVQQFVARLSTMPDFPYRLAAFAATMRGLHADEKKVQIELALRARALAPHDTRLRWATEWALMKRVPRWHFPLVHDHRRNAAYERALQHFVTPETCVLEIGTGSGLLAMLAARAGARHVYTCEAEPLVAAAAQENIIRNGFAERVTVIAKKSTELTIGVDLPEHAGLLVCELFSSTLLSESVLPVIEDARTRLLRPDASIVPAHIALRGVLVGGPAWTEGCRMDEICGLDLSAFNCLAPPTVVPRIADRALDDALSDETELLRFDFPGPSDYPAEQRLLTIQTTRDGVAHGMLLWLWLGFSDTIQFDNKPPQHSSWYPQLHVFPEPRQARAGGALQVTVVHDRRTVMIWPQ
jgi:type II protein arginine methyltransferase